MRYTLGSWGSDRSYVIGYGPNWPKQPHHRQSACSATYSEPCVLSNGGTCCAGERGGWLSVACYAAAAVWCAAYVRITGWHDLMIWTCNRITLLTALLPAGANAGWYFPLHG